MPKKNDFKLDVVSVRLVKDAPIYSEHTFNNPADIAAVMGAVSYTHLDVYKRQVLSLRWYGRLLL